MVSKKIIRFSGNLILFFIAINFYVFVIVACVSGTYSLNVYFNGFGEGPLECIVYMIILPIIIYSTLLNINNFCVDRKINSLVKKGKI